MKIVKIEIKELSSQRDQCILTITTDVNIIGNPSNVDLPTVMQQFPTDVAKELKAAWEKSQTSIGIDLIPVLHSMAVFPRGA
jgi:hypothetical protein